MAGVCADAAGVGFGRTGKLVDHFELRYDANGRLVEKVRAKNEPRERITSSKIENGELVTTYVTEDAAAVQRWRYHYDCGAAP